MEKKNIIISIITIISVVVVFVIVNNWDKSNKQESSSNHIISNETNRYDKVVINEIKNQINATAQTEMYQIEEEYDGRKILQIRPEIQFQTVLAGILKREKPHEEEIQELEKKQPKQKGIWISEQAREPFLKQLLEENQIKDYTINEQGYLKYTRKEDEDSRKKILNTAIDANKQYIIDMEGKTYIRDEFTGEIVEYPFEKMDPYQAIDIYRKDESTILEITTNEKKKLSNQEILEEILLNLE
jgi:hypothetical protein